MQPPIKTFFAGKLGVRVHAKSAELAFDAAHTAREILQSAIRRSGHASAILATGNSQLEFLRTLTTLDGIDWQYVTLFHMDEYLGIDANHSASFRRYLRENVLKHITPRAFHFMEGDALEPLNECERYTTLIRAQKIDLCCLGIGENGHLAFNDPPVADFDDKHVMKIVKLDDACRKQQVGEGHFPNMDAVPKYALTLTIPALRSADKMLCIVPELRKAPAVEHALTEPIGAQCPASCLREAVNATLYLDSGSASLLS